MKLLKHLTVALLLLFFGCKPQDETVPLMPDDDIADLVAASLADNSMGLGVGMNGAVVAIGDALGFSQNGKTESPCGQTVEKTARYTSQANAQVQYDYSFRFVTVLNCNANNIPQSASGSFTFNGEFDGPRLFSDNSGTGTMTVTNLLPITANYVAQGDYSRTGSFKLKHGLRREGTSTTDIVYDLLIGRLSRQVTGGTGTVAVSGNTTGFGPFTANGTLVFEGNQKAVLNINGKSYRIDLANGTVVKL